MRKAPLCRLVYVSRSALSGSAAENEREVMQILDASRRNNTRDGITGALLFSDDCFAQVLEGSRAAVEKVFERIQIDERHRGTVVLACDPAPAREFGEWAMAYVGREAAREAHYAQFTRENRAAIASQEVLGLLRGAIARTSAA